MDNTDNNEQPTVASEPPTEQVDETMPAPMPEPAVAPEEVKPATKIPEQQQPEPPPPPAQPPVPESSSSINVGGAIFATVIIVIAIAALIVYAYLKSK
jgi:hypothetical protein